MPLQIEALPAFETNYIWAIHDGRYCALVDPGSAEEPLEFLRLNELELCAILLTHHHADHIGGVEEILAFKKVPVWGPDDPRIPKADRRVAEGDSVTLPELGLELTVLATPGHTLSHIVYYNDSMLLAGDTLFSAGCGRLFEGGAEQMQASLDKLSVVPDGAQVYCAHEYTSDNCRFALAVEPDNAALEAWSEEVRRLRSAGQITLPTRMDHERRINPFLRTSEPAVIASAKQHDPHCGEAPADVLAAIRRWKDSF
ncbi:MAG: hydroxyacylglutathione hydrolase [Wenzhouxiangella sp.]|jgi:hydroxyacylglutathione hydrolase|nr:hydroxyacylglutathione hydrolase [Wenzhouxiangella sp.]